MRKLHARRGFLGLLLFLGGCSGGKIIGDSCEFEDRIPSMGSVFELQTVDACEGAARSERILRVKHTLDELEAELSLYQPESEISRLNREGFLPNASQDFLNLVEISRDAYSRTDGAFNIAVLPVLREIELYFSKHHRPPSRALLKKMLPLLRIDGLVREGNSLRFKKKGMAITLDGVAKGYAVDQVAGLLAADGVENYLLNFSGNMRFSGKHRGGHSWKIATWNPVKEKGIVIQETEGAIASSGPDNVHFSQDLSWNHIIDPGSAESADKVRAATAIGPTATDCDILSTTLFVLGPERGHKILRDHWPGYRAVFVDKLGEQN